MSYRNTFIIGDISGSDEKKHQIDDDEDELKRAPGNSSQATLKRDDKEDKKSPQKGKAGQKDTDNSPSKSKSTKKPEKTSNHSEKADSKTFHDNKLIYSNIIDIDKTINEYQNYVYYLHCRQQHI